MRQSLKPQTSLSASSHSCSLSHPSPPELPLCKVVVIYTDVKEVKRPSPEYEYEEIPGIKKTFLFQAVRGVGVLLERKFPCWCPSCSQMSYPGEGAMDSSYECVECDTWQHAREGDDLPWKETSVARTDATGLRNRDTRVRAQARNLRDQLLRKWQHSNAPVWVAVENRAEAVRAPPLNWPPRPLHCMLPLLRSVTPALAPNCRTRIATGLARRSRW